MMSAFFSGVSGLKAQTYDLDVIANNIANVNTTGYKSERVSFSDLLSQTLSAATGATATGGGTNAKQIGLGVSVASTDTNMTAGSTESTGVSTDLSISGTGFFIVQGGSTGQYQFTREGDFTVDDSGDLTVNGYKVCGWESYTTDASGTSTFDTTKAVAPINLYSDAVNGNKKQIAAKASTENTLSGNIYADNTATGTGMQDIGTTPTTFDSSQTVKEYDAQGNSYDVTVSYKKCYSENGYTSYYWQASSSDATVTGSGYVCFDSSGNQVTSDGTNTYSETASLTVDPTSTDAGRAAFNVTLDFSGITQTTSTDTSDTLTYTGDGYEAGSLQSTAIGSDGVITGTYSNGQTKPLGEIALATFTNPQGLEKIGDNLYATTTNSGEFTGGVVAGNAGTGSLSSGTLEMSNVDLAEQLSQMMIAERAYQANTKAISTADEMLQSLIAMKG